MNRQETIDEFHKLYYSPAHSTTYLGLPLWKSPTDIFLYQELILAQRPDVIVECGTAYGASALLFANFTEAAGLDCGVLTIDLAEGTSFQGVELPRHERITYLRGRSSVADDVLELVRAETEGLSRMVILDSDHSKEHVLAELEAYAPLVDPGGILVVEDTNVNGHPVFPEHGPGPFEALEEWLPEHRDFRRFSPERNRYLLTFHSWLQRRA